MVSSLAKNDDLLQKFMLIYFLQTYNKKFVDCQLRKILHCKLCLLNNNYFSSVYNIKSYQILPQPGVNGTLLETIKNTSDSFQRILMDWMDIKFQSLTVFYSELWRRWGMSYLNTSQSSSKHLWYPVSGYLVHPKQ